MADMSLAKISIGGTTARSAPLYPKNPNDDTTILQGLISALNNDKASNEYGGAIIQDEEATALADYLDGDVLVFVNDQAVNGEFEDTELFCAENRIPFDRLSVEEKVYGRPTKNGYEALLMWVDSDEREMVVGEVVRGAMALLIAHISPSLPCSNEIRDTGAKVHVALDILRIACPELPPNLKPFKIV